MENLKGAVSNLGVATPQEAHDIHLMGSGKNG